MCLELSRYQDEVDSLVGWPCGLGLSLVIRDLISSHDTICRRRYVPGISGYTLILLEIDLNFSMARHMR
jgi:hypothetical protein